MVDFAIKNTKGFTVLPTYYWHVIFVAGDSFLYGDMLGGKNAEALVARVITSDIPVASHDVMWVQDRRFRYPEQGIVHREGQINLQAIERHDGMILHAWALIYHKAFDAKNGTMDIKAKGKDYKFQVKLQLYNGYNDTAANKPLIVYTLERCILGDVNPGGQLEPGASPNYFQPSITIHYASFSTEVNGKVIDSLDK